MNLCRALVGKGATVRSFARDAFPPGDSTQDWRRDVECICGDFSDSGHVTPSLRDIDVLFHLISTTRPATSNQDSEFDLSSNVLPTLKLLEVARNAGVAKVVFISSGGYVYGNPKRVPVAEDDDTNPICAYGIHKLSIEKYLHLFHHMNNLEYGVLRVSNAYGIGQLVNRQGVIASFVHRAANHQPLEVCGDGGVIRDYIYIDDVIEAFLLLVGHQGPSRVFNIGSGQGHTLLDLVSMIENIIGEAVEVRFREDRTVDVPVNVLDISRAKAELNWCPKTDLETGMRRMMNTPCDSTGDPCGSQRPRLER
jgi:UDP-glucose 4-epimerase